MATDREERVAMAKLAEQAERYDEVSSNLLSSSSAPLPPPRCTPHPEDPLLARSSTFLDPGAHLLLRLPPPACCYVSQFPLGLA